MHDWVRQAVAIAKEMPGTPVKLIWSREEDMLHGRYHPVTQCKLTAGLDAQGNITALHMRISGQSILAGVFPQNIKDGKDPVVFQGLNPPGPEASIGYSFPEPADRPRDAQPARAARLLARREPEPERDLPRVLHRRGGACDRAGSAGVAAQADGQPSEAPRGAECGRRAGRLGQAAAGRACYRGLAQTMGFGSYVAACAEVSVSHEGVLKIHRIVAATDPGHAVNPQQIEAQVEGSFAYGLSAALHGECTVKDGRIEQDNFHTYPVLRMDEMPAVETIVVPSGGFWGGVGEPTIAVAAPAVLNAIFAATGKRIRDLPLKNHSLKQA